MAEYESVERPQSKRQGLVKWPLDAFLETAQTGLAIRVPLDGTSYGAWASRVEGAAARRGLAYGIRRAGPDHIVIWCEPRT